MARFIDDLFAWPWEFPFWSGEVFSPHVQAISNHYRSLADDSTLILAQNVADYFHMADHGDFCDLRKDYPCVAPPFSNFWIEWAAPSHFQNEQHQLVPHNIPKGRRRFGVLFQVLDPLQASPLDDLYETLGYGIADLAAKWKEFPEIERARWLLRAVLFQEFDGLILGPVSIWNIMVDPEGSILGLWFHLLGMETKSINTLATDDRTGEEMWANYANAIRVPLLTISFMSCRNVRVTLEEPPPKLSRSYEKKHGRPLMRYHVLEIDPMKEILKREGQSEETGLKRALHICRGHFATYTPEKPLFGRTTGRIWRGMHTRGNLKEGLVGKSYAVKGR